MGPLALLMGAQLVDQSLQGVAGALGQSSNIYGAAGVGHGGAAETASGVLSNIPLLGGLGRLISEPFAKAEREAAGRRMFGQAQSDMAAKIAAKPYKYSDLGVRQTFSQARSDLERTNLAGTNALLDRYSSIQRRNLQNKISSGLTSGAAAAQQIQSNIAFQQQANQLFQQQGSQLSNLRLREGQALQQMSDVVDARKDQLARKSLISAGVTDPNALVQMQNKLSY